MRIAVCIPLKSGLHQYAVGHLLALWSESIRAGLTMAIIQTDRSPIASARNDLARKALAIKPDRILFIDGDMLYPANALLRLLRHDKDAVSCFYPMRYPPYESTGVAVDPHCNQFGMQRAKQFGFGFVLLKPRVFEAMSAPWFAHRWGIESEIADDNLDGEVSEDVHFCRNAVAAGFELWADLDLSYELGHITENIVQVPRPPHLEQRAA